ncbi:MAG: alpha/beta hydrolase [Chloroflexi bacterium]|nr:MAG: alpha/beta hydrolase [Chloroflexota bacterium]
MTASTHMINANGLRFRTAHAGFLAVAPDLRGYGLTDAPEGVENYGMEHLVADAKGLIESFGRRSAHIAGHDWGAVVAWYSAGAHPDMTVTLTALSVGHPAALAAASREDPDQQTRQSYIGLFVQAGKAERVLTDQDSRRLRAMYRVGPNPDAMPERVIEGFVRSMTRPGRLTAGLNYYRANLKTGGAAWERLQRMGDITSPTQLIWGDQDPALGRRQAEQTRAHVKGRFHLEVLEGAGHWLQFERPDEVALALSQVTAI